MKLGFEKEDKKPKNEMAVSSSGFLDEENEGQKQKGYLGTDNPMMQQSLHSTNVSSINQKYPTARELSETFSGKLYEMRWIAISIVFNALLLHFFIVMGDGLTVPLPISTVQTFATVTVEVLLLVANIVTMYAFDRGAAAYFGFRYAKPTGYSLVACGFIQSNSIKKVSFCNELSLNSSCRKLLTRIAIFWVALDFLKLLTPFSATAIEKDYNRIDDGSIACFLFEEKGEPYNRGWPTASSTQGYAELIFGTALGLVRSEFPDLTNDTIQVMAPQIVGAVQDGDTISGPGFTTHLFTECNCSGNNTAQALRTIASDLTEDQSVEMERVLRNTTGFYLLNHLGDIANDEIKLTSVLGGSSICGDPQSIFTPVCVTRFYNHSHAEVKIKYMTDGNPSSIAADRVDVLSVGDKANMTWVHESLKNIFEGKTVSVMPLPPTVPGITNPIVWWTTPNLVSIDPSLLDAGLETTFNMLLRAGMQRTFATVGSSCVTNIADPNTSFVRMLPYGVTISIIILATQLIACISAIICFIPWVISSDPIGPCVRILNDTIYFNTLLNTSSINSGFYEFCNAPEHMIWQALDVPVRIGESLNTTTDEVGHVCMDKPKLVTSFQNGRKYY